MGVFRQFPYSNFHEMNLDEIIKTIKNMLEEWAQYYSTWDDWKTQVTNEWAEMREFINTYFDNLDVQNEINNKISSMVASGEFGQIVSPYVPDAAAEWLAVHITQPVGVVIDDSLSVAGACADAKATGDRITNNFEITNEALSNYLFPTNYDFILGGVDSSTGVDTVSNVRARTDFIPYEISKLVIVSDPDYTISVAYYDTNYDWIISHWWYTSPYMIQTYSATEALNTAYVKIIIKRVDEGDIDIIDLNSKIRVCYTNNTDKTLTVSGSNADAKATGDAIENNFEITNTALSNNLLPMNYNFELGTINGSTGAEESSFVRARSGFIPYNHDEIVVVTDPAYTISVAYYDVNQDWFISHWWFNSPYTIKSYSRTELFDTKYVRVVIKRVDENNIDINDLNDKIRICKKPDIPRTYRAELDGTGDFTSLYDAIIVAEAHFNSTVIVGAGTWDIIADMTSAYVETVDASNRGIYLKNGITLKCSSKSKITCNYTGATANVRKWLAVFNAGEYGFTLENANIEASNIRYVIHDERDTDTDIYTNNYINCTMNFDNSANTDIVSNQCIGGGLGVNGHINIYGGKYVSQGQLSTIGESASISYHNSLSANAKNRIDIHDVYLAGFLRINYYGTSTEKTNVYVSGCSFETDIISTAETPESVTNNIAITSWDNTIRNATGAIHAYVGTIDSNFTYLAMENGIAVFTLLWNGVNVTTSNQHIGTLDIHPINRMLTPLYDKNTGKSVNSYLDTDGKFYVSAYEPISSTNLRGSMAYVVANNN